MKKIIRITTVPVSLKVLLRGQLKFLNQHFEIIGVASPLKELKEVEEQEGIRTYGIEMTRTITPIKDFMALLNCTGFSEKKSL
ncbi:MAG: hypothetical protein KJN68_12335 [Bacteroidia bacterium]|nr:hypothetical protein [Bacteroidia bacterium]